MGFIERLFGKKQSAAASPRDGGMPAPFAVGDRVRDIQGQCGVVTSVDPAAEHGLGRVVVKMDDGREVKAALVASGLERETGCQVTPGGDL
jgi:hypothetical protein